MAHQLLLDAKSEFEQYGVPKALHTDWKNLFLQSPSAREQIRGEKPQTQFGRMCAELGIRIIPANSPQAKGQVERGHGTRFIIGEENPGPGLFHIGSGEVCHRGPSSLVVYRSSAALRDGVGWAIQLLTNPITSCLCKD